MTAPYTQDPTPEQINQLRTLARKNGWPPEVIEQRLVDAGLIQATQPRPGRQPIQPRGPGLATSFGRGMIQGAGNLAGMLPGGGGMFNQLAGLPPQGTLAANELGIPQPVTGRERIAQAAGEGVGASVAMPGASIPMMGLGGLAGAAGGVAGEAGAGPLGQMAASAAVGFGLPVAGMVLSAGIRSALAGAASRRAAAQQSLALVQAGNPAGEMGPVSALLKRGEGGAAVTLGQVAEGGMARTLEGGLKNIPGSSGAFSRTLEKQADEMGQRVERVASRMGPPAAKEVVGAAVQRGIKEGFIPNFRAKADELYKKVYSLVKPDTPVTPTAVTQLIAKQNDMLGMARELSDDIVNPKIKNIFDHIDETVASAPPEHPGTIPFGTLKELRSRLFAMENGDELIADINMRDVRLLRKAITADMGATVQRVAGARGTEAWNAANAFYKKGSETISKILDPLVAKRTPEQAFTALMSGTKEGATALQATLNSLPAAERGLVRSNVLRQLGRMPDETFSPELFLRKLHSLAPTARTALFDGDQVTGVNLSALAEIAEARKAAGRVMFNPSGTAPNVMFQAVLNGLSKLTIMGGTGALTMGGGRIAAGAMAAPVLSAFAANQLAERVFTNPRMIQWLVRTTKVPYGAFHQELALLAKDSQKWGPEDRQLAQDLSGTLSQMDWRSILLAQAGADATTTR